MAELLNDIIQAVQSGNLPVLEDLFKSLNLTEQTPDRQWSLFNFLGHHAQANNQPNSMIQILDKWSEIQIDESNGPMEFNSYLFIQPQIDAEVLEFVAISDEDISFVS